LLCAQKKDVGAPGSARLCFLRLTWDTSELNGKVHAVRDLASSVQLETSRQHDTSFHDLNKASPAMARLRLMKNPAFAFPEGA
jgi:hypothetical protein